MVASGKETVHTSITIFLIYNDHNGQVAGCTDTTESQKQTALSHFLPFWQKPILPHVRASN